MRKSGSLGEARSLAGTGGVPAVDPEAVREAQNELWKGQCNCAYWHGVFGGLYLPHLRSAIYEHLIRAENLLDSTRGTGWDHVDVVDHDLDGNDDVLLESHWANVYVSPARGGAVFELDVRRACWNVLGTMSHYAEAYYRALDDEAGGSADGEVGGIHDAVRAKEKGLERLVRADELPRRAAVDHFLPPATKRAELERATVAEVGDFVDGRYEFELARKDATVGVVMRREGFATDRGSRLAVQKTVWLTPGNAVHVEYVLTARDDVDVLFAPEWNLAFLTDNRDVVFLRDGEGEPLCVSARATFRHSRGISITDLLRNEELSFRCEPACSLWIYPLETVSQSEGGLERVFQGTTVVATWPIELRAGGRTECSVILSVVPKEP